MQDATHKDMDLLETTLKVIENQNAARENLTAFQENIQQYEDYINAMKENLEEILLTSSGNKEILEMNNFTKNVFNENCKMVKDLFGKVYNYTQQIQEKLSTIMDQEASLVETYNENEERYSHLETKYTNNLTLLVILEKDSVEKLTKEMSDIQHQLNETNEEFVVLSKLWKDITDGRDDKYKTLQATTQQVEILHNKIQANHDEDDLYARTMEKKKEDNQKLIEEIAKDIETMDNQLLQTEEDIAVILNGNLKEELKVKEDMLHTQNEALMNLEKLNKDYSETEILVSTVQDTSLSITKDLRTEVESTKNRLAENKEKLLSFDTKHLQISKENDQLLLKISTAEGSLKNMRIQCEVIHDETKEILQSTADLERENEQLTNDYEKLLHSLPTCKSDVCKKESELQELKNSPNVELLKIEENIKKLESENSLEEQRLQSETQSSDSDNKRHQQTIEELESTLKDLELQYAQFEKEKKNFEEKKCSARESELRSSTIKRWDAGKQKKSKLIPTPPLKRIPPPQKRIPPPQLPKKRTLLDTESDSSVDGESISYEEFMAKKKFSRNLKK